MSRSFQFLLITLLVILSLTVLGGMIWGNTEIARIQHEEKDFLVPWLAARTFLEYGDGPYSLPASQRAQIIFYGRLAESNEDPLVLWIPFPAQLFYFPFAFIQDYELARGFWTTLTEIALFTTAILGLKVTNWKPSRFLLPLILIFPIFWFYGYMNIQDASPIPFLLCASTGVLLAIRSGQDEIAGICLLFPLLDFRLFGLYVVSLLWWSLTHRRWRVFGGLGMALGILLLFSFILLPDWPLSFWRGYFLHLQYDSAISTFLSMKTIWPVAGPRIGAVFTAFFVIIFIFELRRLRRGDFRHILWNTCLTLSMTLLVGFPVGRGSLLILILPFYFFLSAINEHWHFRQSTILTLIVLFFILLASWALMFVLDYSQALIFPALMILGLYWVRWWILRPTPLTKEYLI